MSNSSSSSSSSSTVALIKLSPQMDSLLNCLAQSVVLPNAIAALFGLPSALLYLLQIYVLIKYWGRFKSSFFLLFIFRAIIALLYMFVNYVNQRFCKLGWFLPVYQTTPVWLLAVAYFFIYYPFHVENLVNFMLLLNRYTSVALKMAYERIWTFKVTAGCILFCCLLPLPFTLHILQYQVYTNIQGKSFILSYTTPQNLQNFTKSLAPPLSYIYIGNNFTAAISSLVFMFLCLGQNILTLIAYRAHRKAFEMTTKAKMERKMTIYALLTLIGQLIISIYMIMWYMVSSFWKPQFDNYTYQLTNLALQNQGPWINDFCTIAMPAWLMFLVNSRMRQIIQREIMESPIGNLLIKFGIVKWTNSNSTTKVAVTATAAAMPRATSDKGLRGLTMITINDPYRQQLPNMMEISRHVIRAKSFNV